MSSNSGNPRNPDHYAIVIGIDKYSQFRRLTAAVADATRFAEWLTSPEGGGLPKGNTHLIVSEKGDSVSNASPGNTSPFMEIPVQTQIDEALARIGVQSKNRIGSRLYFYFAGHGFGPNFADVGMLMANAANERLNSNVGLNPYRHFFRDWGFFDEVIFILDCCRDEFVSVSETTRPTFTLGQINGPRPPVNDFIVLAAPHGEKAFQALNTGTTGTTAPPERRGLLTNALLEALKKAEAADSRGRFTAASLEAYVKTRVPQLALMAPIDPKTGKPLKQDPQIDPPQKEIVFGTVPFGEVEKIRVRIVAPAGMTGMLQLLGSDFLPIGESRNASDVTIDQPAWEENLIRQKWYAVTNTNSPAGTPPMIIDLRGVKQEPHVITL